MPTYRHSPFSFFKRPYHFFLIFPCTLKDYVYFCDVFLISPKCRWTSMRCKLFICSNRFSNFHKKQARRAFKPIPIGVRTISADFLIRYCGCGRPEKRMTEVCAFLFVITIHVAACDHSKARGRFHLKKQLLTL